MAIASLWASNYNKSGRINFDRTGVHNIAKRVYGSLRVEKGYKMRYSGSYEGWSPWVYGEIHYVEANYLDALIRRYQGPGIVRIEIQKHQGAPLIFLHHCDDPRYSQFYQRITRPASTTPVGMNDANDWTDLIDVPQGLRCVLYKDGPNSGGQLELGPGRHNLGDYGWGRCVSFYKTQAEQYKLVRAWISEGKVVDDGPATISKYEHVNNASQGDPDEVSLGQDRNIEFTKEENWNSETGIELSITAGTGESSPCKFEVSASISQSFSIGESKSETRSQSVSGEVLVHVPPKHRSWVIQKLVPRKGTYISHRILEDSNGNRIQESGIITCKGYSFESSSDSEKINT